MNENNQVEIYPIPLVITLTATDIEKSIKWYKEVIGFSSLLELKDHTGQISFAHLRLDKYQDLMITKGSGSLNQQKLGNGVTIGLGNTAFKSGEDIDGFSERLKANGATILEGPADRPWNLRELVVADPDGYILIFSQVLQQANDFSEVLGDIEEQSGLTLK